EGSIAESYATAQGEEIWLINSHIPEYSHGNRLNHEREALAGHCTVQLGDFPVLQQQLPRPARRVIKPVAVALFGDVAVDQPDFLALGRRIALGDRSLALPQRLDLGSRQLNPGLEPLLDEIVEARAAVFGHDLLLVERLRERFGHEA